MDAATLWAVVALVVSVAGVAVLGYLAARPAIVLEADRRALAEQRAEAAEAALVLLGQRHEDRQRGAQIDADEEAETARAMAGAAGDPRGAALALVRLRRAREAAALAAAGTDRGASGVVGADRGVAAVGPSGRDHGGAGPGASLGGSARV